MRPSRIAAIIAVAVLAIAVVALGMRMRHVHELGWEWRLTPTATPPLVQYEGRQYKRSNLPPDASLEGLIARDDTPGGGTVYAIPGTRTPVTIVVVDGDRRVEYALMGGP